MSHGIGLLLTKVWGFNRLNLQKLSIVDESYSFCVRQTSLTVWRFSVSVPSCSLLVPSAAMLGEKGMFLK